MADETFVEKLTEELSDSGATTEMLSFALTNVGLLQTLGAEIVQQIVGLLNNGQNQEAIVLLDSKMTPDQIIAREKLNAQELEVYNKNREKFLADLKTFAWKLVPVLIKVATVL